MAPIRLRTGDVLRVRPIQPDDDQRLTVAHARLSARTQYQRYLAFKPRLTSGDARYLTDVDAHNHVALVVTPFADPDRIVASARFVRLTDDPTAAEWAIVLDDEYQHVGLGRALMERLIDAAVSVGVTRFTGTMLADNVGAHQLVHSIAPGTPRWTSEGDTDEVEFDLVPARALAA